MASTAFTPEIRAALIERFGVGCTTADAATAAGVAKVTVERWLTRGRKDEEGEFADFARAVEEAREAHRTRPEPMDEDELERTVSHAARKGNTQAMKLRWEMLEAKRKRESGSEEPADPLDSVDELAERRSRAA